MILPPDARARFQSDIATLAPEDARIGLAVSGGPDSLGLLLLAHAHGGPFEAATVDHGLRPEAAAEAEFVSGVCAQLGVPHQILTLKGPPMGNASAWARRERYAALENWRVAHKLDLIATAHHADDQLETLLMRLNRGAGIAGLSGIRARRGRIIRPLLGWRKAELQALVAAAGLQAVDDPSNGDDRFDRARLRKALATADWLDPQSAARSAAALASAEEALNWAAAQEARARVVPDDRGGVILDVTDLPFELRRRLVLVCLTRVMPDAAPRDDELHRLIARVEAGQATTLAGVKAAPGPRWRFTKAPPPRPITRNS
jgi:tRNA(Ile)-lysidine synthase